jgi:hypothetical protein
MTGRYNRRCAGPALMDKHAVVERVRSELGGLAELVLGERPSKLHETSSAMSGPSIWLPEYST